MQQSRDSQMSWLLGTLASSQSGKETGSSQPWERVTTSRHTSLASEFWRDLLNQALQLNAQVSSSENHPKSTNLEIISKVFLQMPGCPIGCNPHFFSIILMKHSQVAGATPYENANTKKVPCCCGVEKPLLGLHLPCLAQSGGHQTCFYYA